MSAGAGASVICSDPLSVNGTFWIAWTRITNQRRDCLVPCHSLMVSVSAKNTRDLQNKNYSEAYLYFPPRCDNPTNIPIFQFHSQPISLVCV